MKSNAFRLRAALAALVVALAACSASDPPDPTIGWSPDRLYAEAKDEMSMANYTRAIELLEKLEDPPTDLVRRDANFTKLGVTDADVETADQVADLLAQHPVLMQRPVLVKGDRAIIGRPKDRVPEFLRG